MIKKMTAILAVMLLVVLLTAGCTTSRDAIETGAESSEKEINKIVMCQSSDLMGSSNITTLTNEMASVSYLANFYETLVNYEKGKITSGLAESWEVNENEITFKLKEGVKFSNGADFNAEVVKKNFDMIPKIWGEMFVNSFTVLKTLDEVKVIDNYTVKLVLTEPYYGALQELTNVNPYGMMSPSAYTEEGLSEGTDSKTFGTGPYMLDSFLKGREYTFVRNDNYWGEQPTVKQFVVKIIPDMESRIMALRAGEIDMIVGANNITYDAFSEFASDDKFEAKISESVVKTNGIKLNTTKPPFDDKNVRLAVQYAIDRQVICDNVLYGIETKADFLLNPELPYCDISLEAYDYDVEKAKDLLDKAGWLAIGKNEIREKDGQRLEAEILFKSGVGVQEDVSLALAGQLKEIGFDVKVTGLERMAWFGKATEGNFTISILETIGIPYDPQIFINIMAVPSWNNPVQQGLAVKPEIDQKIKELSNTIDSEKIQRIYDYILTTLHQEALYVPVSYSRELVIFNKELIKDYKFNGQPSKVDVSGIIAN